MSTIALHSTLNISETVTDRGWLGSKGPPIEIRHMGYQMVTWPMASMTWPQRCWRQYDWLS